MLAADNCWFRGFERRSRPAAYSQIYIIAYNNGNYKCATRIYTLSEVTICMCTAHAKRPSYLGTLRNSTLRQCRRMTICSALCLASRTCWCQAVSSRVLARPLATEETWGVQEGSLGGRVWRPPCDPQAAVPAMRTARSAGAGPQHRPERATTQLLSR